LQHTTAIKIYMCWLD